MLSEVEAADLVALRIRERYIAQREERELLSYGASGRALKFSGLPELSMLRNWDKCERLRRGIVAKLHKRTA